MACDFLLNDMRGRSIQNPNDAKHKVTSIVSMNGRMLYLYDTIGVPKPQCNGVFNNK